MKTELPARVAQIAPLPRCHYPRGIGNENAIAAINKMVMIAGMMKSKWSSHHLKNPSLMKCLLLTIIADSRLKVKLFTEALK